MEHQRCDGKFHISNSYNSNLQCMLYETCWLAIWYPAVAWPSGWRNGTFFKVRGLQHAAENDIDKQRYFQKILESRSQVKVEEMACYLRGANSFVLWPFLLLFGLSVARFLSWACDMTPAVFSHDENSGTSIMALKGVPNKIRTTTKNFLLPHWKK